MKHPNIVDAYQLIAWGDEVQKEVGGKYVPARGCGYHGSRFRAAWKVFTGKADALIWPGQGD